MLFCNENGRFATFIIIILYYYMLGMTQIKRTHVGLVDHSDTHYYGSEVAVMLQQSRVVEALTMAQWWGASSARSQRSP